MSPCHEHNISRKSRCRECGIKASGICEHKYRKRRCRICAPAGYLAHISGVRIRAALKAQTLGKNKKSIEYLNIDIDEYKKHIEKTFKVGMTWENHGDWHIDHIYPLCYDNPSDDEIIKRLHYSNTQALWANENMSKGNRYIGDFR